MSRILKKHRYHRTNLNIETKCGNKANSNDAFRECTKPSLDRPIFRFWRKTPEFGEINAFGMRGYFLKVMESDEKTLFIEAMSKLNNVS